MDAQNGIGECKNGSFCASQSHGPGMCMTKARDQIFSDFDEVPAHVMCLQNTESVTYVRVPFPSTEPHGAEVGSRWRRVPTVSDAEAEAVSPSSDHLFMSLNRMRSGRFPMREVELHNTYSFSQAADLLTQNFGLHGLATKKQVIQKCLDLDIIGSYGSYYLLEQVCYDNKNPNASWVQNSNSNLKIQLTTAGLYFIAMTEWMNG